MIITGITCSVWACFEDNGEFKRLSQKNCSAFYGKDSYMHHQMCRKWRVASVYECCESLLVCFSAVKDECVSQSDNNCHHDAFCSNLENDTFMCSCDVG